MATTLIDRTRPGTEPTPKAADAPGVSCHAGKEELTKAAAAAGQPPPHNHNVTTSPSSYGHKITPIDSYSPLLPMVIGCFCSDG